eukprot:Clim_evm1s12 gene=Clim_evmTU1s12
MVAISRVARQAASKTYDYVIVGGGSTGAVLANRLSKDPNTKVALLEAGPPDTSPFIHTPLGAAWLMPYSRKYNWRFDTVPQEGLNNRIGYQPRGKTLGGSSSINAMVYIRGTPWDYDQWEKRDGAEGWGWDSLLPYFKETENNLRIRDSALHGTSGELYVSDVRHKHRLTQAWLDTIEGQGTKLNDDFNGPVQEGYGWFQTTTYEGNRWSAASAFIHPIKGKRPNLDVLTSTQATKLLIDGNKVTGLETMNASGRGQVTTLNCKEVILSAGAFQSPQLLMVSGIGPRKELEKVGIDVKHNMPGVGQNLQDHPDAIAQWATKGKWDSLNQDIRALPLNLSACVEYYRSKTGRLSSNGAEAGGFFKSDPSLETCDVQYHFVPGLIVNHGRNIVWRHGFSIHICQLFPKSRGYVGVKSNSTFDAPIIDPAFLQHPDDVLSMIAGMRDIRRTLKNGPISETILRELKPGADATDDKHIEDWIRSAGADSVYHPVGTCRMGKDADAVLDPANLRVWGMEGIRVCDASIMPTIIGGNTNAPCMAMGAKLGAEILANEIGYTGSRTTDEPLHATA